MQDSTLHQWKHSCRDCYVLELLHLDGCGDASEEVCPGCEIAENHPVYCCRECKGGLLFCRNCCVSRHLENPLHVVEVWNGAQFKRTSLKALGIRVLLGHLPGEHCANPEAGRAVFFILHCSGIHEVAVDFCGCEQRSHVGRPDAQLLRIGWYPASEARLQTCMTLMVLDQFHIMMLRTKTTMYDYYKFLEKLTAHDRTKPPDRYQVFICMAREYHHLMMLKRGGRGHASGGAAMTKPGELAVACPACPRPGINLPADWENTPKEDSCVSLG
ncbi:hypothetical protein K438DRAFT_1581642 [Mycena galopus ATCC 62051]|nr:hypothetical protein K438DRAFT_1581642 [Mycena galopus ATCC 62051]